MISIGNQISFRHKYRTRVAFVRRCDGDRGGNLAVGVGPSSELICPACISFIDHGSRAGRTMRRLRAERPTRSRRAVNPASSVVIYGWPSTIV